MDDLANPYTPGAGEHPAALTGRDAQISQFRLLLGRLERRKAEKRMIISGLRGVGKTVLLNEFETIAEGEGWSTASREVASDTDLRFAIAEMSHEILRGLTRRTMGERLRRALGVLKAFSVKTPEGYEITVDVDALTGYADTGDLERDTVELFLEIGAAALEAKTGVLFLFDEMQLLQKRDLEALCAAVHRVGQKRLPVALAGAGLPHLPTLLVEAKTYAERLFAYPELGPLDREAAEAALVLPAHDEGVEYEPEALQRILDYSEGYPYFLQEYGKFAWRVAPRSPITLAGVEKACPLVQDELDREFFQLRFNKATPAERRYMAAMADLGDGPQSSDQVAKHLGYAGMQGASVIRDRLIKKGLVYSPERGLVAFTVPHFADYMRRKFPFES